MTGEQLKQLAIDCLAKVFIASPYDSIAPAYVVEAAISILLTPKETI